MVLGSPFQSDLLLERSCCCSCFGILACGSCSTISLVGKYSQFKLQNRRADSGLDSSNETCHNSNFCDLTTEVRAGTKPNWTRMRLWSLAMDSDVVTNTKRLMLPTERISYQCLDLGTCYTQYVGCISGATNYSGSANYPAALQLPRSCSIQISAQLPKNPCPRLLRLLSDEPLRELC